MFHRWIACQCGRTDWLWDGEPCPKCGAVSHCLDCGLPLRGEVVVMRKVTDNHGTGLRGFCVQCAAEQDELARDLEPILPDLLDLPEPVVFDPFGAAPEVVQEVEVCGLCNGTKYLPVKGTCPACHGTGLIDLGSSQEPAKVEPEPEQVSLADEIEAYLRQHKGGGSK